MSFAEQWKQGIEDKRVVDVSPKWLAWEADGQFILGRLRSTSEVASSLGEGTYLQYLMDTDDGLVKFSLGHATDNEMKSVLVVGGVFQITYVGQIKIKGGRRVNQFKVQALQSGDDLGVSDDDVPLWVGRPTTS